ncbi:MAG: MAPEG family protein [Rhizobiaceae bacterium]
MSTPILVMTLYAIWTLILLFGSVGIYRWSRILTGRADIKQWRADEQQGNEWYRRAMRAHMNCVENLPVYSALAIAAAISNISTPGLDRLAITVLVARILQSLIHILVEQTNKIATIRFILFFVQAVCMIAMFVILITN